MLLFAKEKGNKFMSQLMKFFKEKVNGFPASRKTAAILSVILLIVLLFVYVVFRSGPLAPISVVLTTVENASIQPALFGIGTIEARSIYKIGPNQPSRVKRVFVHVGDKVKASQWLVEMERPDLDLLSTDAEKEFVISSMTPEQSALMKKKDGEDLILPSANLRLRTPVTGLVISRNAEPGTTVVAGQSVVEVIDPKELWINTRFDQVYSAGLRSGLQTKISLRSQKETFNGKIFRVEPLADSVTEETLAKVVFDNLPATLPPLGELAEVTVALPALEPKPMVPNASLQRIEGNIGVWVVENKQLKFVKVKIGASDLEGRVQISDGVSIGDRVVVYSKSPLNSKSRIKIVDSLMDKR